MLQQVTAFTENNFANVTAVTDFTIGMVMHADNFNVSAGKRFYMDINN